MAEFNCKCYRIYRSSISVIKQDFNYQNTCYQTDICGGKYTNDCKESWGISGCYLLTKCEKKRPISHGNSCSVYIRLSNILNPKGSMCFYLHLDNV